METIMFNTVKESRNIETNELEAYIVDGMYVPLDPANGHYQAVQKWIAEGNQPEPAYTDDERLEYFKNKLLKEVKSITEARYQKSVIHSDTLDKDIDAGVTALTNVDGLISILENDDDTVDFRLADNSFITITKADLEAIKKEIILAGQNLYKTKWLIEDQINNLTDVDTAAKATIDFDNATLVTGD